MKDKINNLPFKWKVFTMLLGFCGLLLLILWLFQIVFLEEFYKSIKVSETRDTASSIANNINNDGVTDLITGLAQRGTSCIEVIFPDGRIYQSNTLKDCAIHRMKSGEKQKLLSATEQNGGELYNYGIPQWITPDDKKHQFDSKFIRPTPEPMESLIYSKMVLDNNSEPVYILISTVISPVNATVLTLRYQLYVITIILLILAVILAAVISKRVSKPIEDLNKGAKELGEGNFKVSFKGDGFLEVRELSATLNHAAKELSKVDGLRKELMANISHDLRTPLSLIYSYAEIMQDFPQEQNSESPKIIMEETKRLTSLVNDVLDVSKLETGGEKLCLRKYNLTESLKATINRINELVRKDGYNISFNYSEDIYVNGDEIKITQAFYNLLINGINYTGADKKVKVTQKLEGNKVKIEIADTGMGISDEDIPFIWDRYYKVDKEHKRAVTGTGLGLFIVKKIIKLHEGECGVRENVDKGSVFWFSLEL